MWIETKVAPIEINMRRIYHDAPHLVFFPPIEAYLPLEMIDMPRI